MGSQMWFRNDTGTISAIPYAVLTVVVFGLFLVGMGVVVDALVEVDNDMMQATTVTTPRPTPVPTPDPGQIAAGAEHALHLTGAGTLVEWDNSGYQAGDHIDGSDIDMIAASLGHSFALRNDGTVIAWGAGDYDDHYSPLNSPPDGNVVAISGGGAHSLALLNDGTVIGWGEDYYGQASPPAGLSGVTAIAASPGGIYSLALTADGEVVQWGLMELLL
jgi:alpha-tubulin suppressor-like RCC1 family protein